MSYARCNTGRQKLPKHSDAGMIDQPRGQPEPSIPEVVSEAMGVIHWLYRGPGNETTKFEDFMSSMIHIVPIDMQETLRHDMTRNFRPWCDVRHAILPRPAHHGDFPLYLNLGMNVGLTQRSSPRSSRSSASSHLDSCAPSPFYGDTSREPMQQKGSYLGS